MWWQDCGCCNWAGFGTTSLCFFQTFLPFFPPETWATPIPVFQEESRVSGSVAAPGHSPAAHPQSGDLKALGRGLNGIEGGFSSNQN